jgi:NAD(P)H dehydrogenase (quinone)
MGGLPAADSDIGAYGPIDRVLFPIHRGSFRFAGYIVIDPFVASAPARIGDDALESRR